MKRIYNLSFWLALLLLGGVVQAQQSVNTIKYKVVYDAGTQTYTTYVVPDYAVPNSNNPLSTEKGSTAQFTIVVPVSFVITSITDINGSWTKLNDLLKLGPGQPGQDWSAYNLNPALNYYVVGKAPSETDYGSFQIGQPVALFSFKGNGCFGPIQPLLANDPFINAADQEYAFNAGNSFNSRSAQPGGGNQNPLEQFVNITGAPADCAPPKVLTANPDSGTTLAGSPTTTSVLANDTNSGQPATTANVTVSISTPPTSGTATVNPDGTITFTPAASFTGTVCYSYKICDLTSTTACSAPAQVCVTVQPVVPPKVLTANPDSATTLAGSPTTTSVLANDTNTGQPATTANVTVSISTPPTSGTATVNPDGTITFTPATSFTGTVCYSYQICDLTSTTACSAPAQVCVTVQPVVPPKVLTANPDSATTLAGSPTTTSVLANDTNTGQPATSANVTVSISTPPTSGTATVNPDGTITFTPAASFTGTVCYSYQICDLTSTTACSAPAQVCVTVQAVVPPKVLTANPDSATTLAGSPTTTSVLANDTNTGQPATTANVTVSISTPPTSGTATVNPDGTITFTPAASFTGTVCYSYQICDLTSTTACSAPAQVCVTVQAVVPPKVLTANPDSATTLAGSPTTTSVLANDTNTGQPATTANVTVSISTPPTSGTATVNPDGTITFTPAANFVGTVCYSYQICDLTSTTACSAPAQVCVTVQAVVPPKVLTANPDSATTLAGSPTTTSVLANDTNTGQPATTANVTVSISTPPTSGTATVNPDGTITFTPAASFTGTVCYSYQICDLTSTTACSAPAQVCVTVQAVVPPKVLTANPDSATTLAGSPTTTSVLANDTNTGQPATTANVTVSISTPPTSGTATVNPDGTITFTPAASFTGTVCYSYQICDLTSTTACSAPAQVCVTVQAVVPPKVLTANPDSATTLAGSPTTTSVLANDTNTGQPATSANVTVSISTPPTSGTATVNPDGTITFTPAASFTGTVCYSYQICDLTSTTACSAPAQVCVTVQAVVPPKVLTANPDSATITAGSSATTPVLLNDTNTGQPATSANVTVSISTPPTSGIATVNPDGTITFTPAANFVGTVCYSYQICDLTSTTACSAPAQVCVTVQAVVPPKVLTANPDNATITAGTPTNINVLANDTNTGQPATTANVTVSLSTPPTSGTATVNPDGTISYSPATSFTGTVCFAYQICDLTSATACSPSAQVCFMVIPKPPGNADVSITKRVVGSKQRALGDVVAFEIVVRNLGPDLATNVVVKDSLSSGLLFQSASVTRGNGTYTNPLLTVASLAAGDSTVLTVLARVAVDGISFNYATVVSQDQIDPNPANNRAQTCTSVAINLCTGQAVMASVPVGFTNVIWYKAGVQVATGNTVTFTQGGTYTFTASNATCPAEGCCPLIVVQSDCCPVNACVPVMITKTRRQ